MIRPVALVSALFVFWLTGADGTVAAEPCLTDKPIDQRLSGKLSIGRLTDVNGRRVNPYILTVPKPVCLTADDPDDNVKSTRVIHVFSTTEATLEQIARLIGKQVTLSGRPFPAHTAYHHAPIVMDVGRVETP